MALVEEPLIFKAKEKDLNARVHFVKSTGTSIEVQASSKAPSFLVLSDVYYPGWEASIDGEKTHIFQTNYVLRGVRLPAGRHTVRFEYRPLSFYLGATTSGFSLLGLISLLFINHRKKSLQKS